MPPRRKKRSLLSVVRPLFGPAAIGASVLVLVAALGLGAAMLLIDPNAYKPEIAAAVKRALGRELQLRGPISIEFGLPPTLVIEDVALANPPGASRPEMVLLSRLEITAALLPLLSHEYDISQLTLRRPDILLESDAAGDGNWQFAPPEPAIAARTDSNGDAQPEPAAAALPAAARGAPKVSVGSLRITDMHVAWYNRVTGQTESWTVPRLEADAEEAGRSMLLTGSIVSGAKKLKITGELGAVGRLLDPVSALPWPLDVTAQSDGVQISARGTLTHALHDVGYSLQLDASVTDLAVFGPLLPQPPPRANEATLSARISNTGAGPAGLTSLIVHTDGLTVPSLLPGVQFGRADLNAPGGDQPARADLQFVASGIPMHLLASAGSLSGILPGAPGGVPVPVEVSVEALGSIASAKGTMLSVSGLSGANLNVVARIANLPAFKPLVNQTLPDWRQMTVDAVLDGKLASGSTVGLHRWSLSLPQGSIGGDVTVALGARPIIRGSVTSGPINLDALLASFTPPPPPPPVRRAGQPVRPPPPAPPPQAIATTWIPDTKFDLSALELADVDLQFAFGALRAKGVSYNNVKGHLLLRDGRLTLAPLNAEVPGGLISGRVSVESRVAEPEFELKLHAPAMPLPALAAVFTAPDIGTGTASVDADLHGAGRSLHALAGTLDGHLGLALAEGDLDNAVALQWLGGVLKAAKLPDSAVSGVGRSKVRCIAGRLDFKQGIGTLAALVADSGKLLVDGTGSADFDHEELSLKLRPMLRTGSAAVPGIVVPVRVDGTFLEPRPTLDNAAAGKGGVLGAVANAVGAVLKDAAGSAVTSGQPGLKLTGDRPGDACPPALAVARGVESDDLLALPVPSAAAAPAVDPAVTFGAPPRRPKPAGPPKLLDLFKSANPIR